MTKPTYTVEQVRAMAGPSKPRRKRKAAPKLTRPMFLAMCRAHGLPEPTPKYRFCSLRRWRFDWAWFDEDSYAPKVAMEIEGGAWTSGRHTRGAGFIGDMESTTKRPLRAGYWSA